MIYMGYAVGMYSKASYAHSLLNYNAKHLSRCIFAKRGNAPSQRGQLDWNDSELSAGTMLCITVL